MFFDSNNPRKKIAWNDYGIFNQNQNKTEIAKTIRCVHTIPYYLNVNTIGDSMVLHGHIELQTWFKCQQISMSMQMTLPSWTRNTRKTKIIRREMDCFETVNIRGKYLGRVFELSTIQPTSVESEHAFSAAVTKFGWLVFIASPFFKNIICDCQFE
jgi:hypothetical protein